MDALRLNSGKELKSIKPKATMKVILIEILVNELARYDLLELTDLTLYPTESILWEHTVAANTSSSYLSYDDYVHHQFEASYSQIV